MMKAFYLVTPAMRQKRVLTVNVDRNPLLDQHFSVRAGMLVHVVLDSADLRTACGLPIVNRHSPRRLYA